MELIRLTSSGDGRFAPAMDLYAHSFPAHEQREAPAQEAALACGDYHFDLICDGDAFVGLLLYWQAPEFLYVEHFCTRPGLRGRGYGALALALLREKGIPVILEIDPPVDEVSRRRLAFYRRAGYRENPFPHVHPPYRADRAGHPLVVLSCPEALTPAQYGRFYAYLCQNVMSPL